MKPSIVQKIYSFITLNYGCSTSEVAKFVDRSNPHTSKMLYIMARRGQIQPVTVGVGRNQQNTWTVTNRAVKFNRSAVPTPQKTANKKDATITLTIKELETMLARLKQQVDA